MTPLENLVRTLVIGIVIGAIAGLLSYSPQPKSASSAATAGKTDPVGKPDRHADPLVPPIDLTGGAFGTDFTSGDRASFHPHGEQVCASGCAVSNHPTKLLTAQAFRKRMTEYSLEPSEAAGEALEQLLYYGRQTQDMLARFGQAPLNDEHARVLRRELTRTHAVVTFRVVDEHGVVRTHLPPTRVPLDRRHVFHMETKNLPPLVTSGTVKRVGLHHLWTRL